MFPDSADSRISEFVLMCSTSAAARGRYPLEVTAGLTSSSSFCRKADSCSQSSLLQHYYTGPAGSEVLLPAAAESLTDLHLTALQKVVP